MATQNIIKQVCDNGCNLVKKLMSSTHATAAHMLRAQLGIQLGT